jgi:hypothetical protein
MENDLEPGKGSELEPGEVISLASAMARAYGQFIKGLQETYGITAPEAAAKESELAAWTNERRGALADPPEQVSWWQLGALSSESPEAVAAAWARIKDAARDELASGHRFAIAGIGTMGTPMDRARLLVIRRSFADEWQPKGGIEASLCDTLALAFHHTLFWSERLITRSAFDAQMEDSDMSRDGKWRPTRIASSVAQEQAMAMVDRWNRIMLRTLRALRDLRRYSPNVTITNPGQVNIGQQQVNVGGPVGDVGEVKGVKSD